jgi:hypothetical protein
MIKLITTILMMIIGSLIFQRFLADDPDYSQTFDMFYWMTFTTVIFLINGVIKLK